MIRKELCSDLKEDDCTTVIKRYAAEFPGLYLSKVGGPPACRSTYVMLLKDMSVPPAQQIKMVDRLDHPTVIEIDSGHLVMLSHPDELADIISDIVTST